MTFSVSRTGELGNARGQVQRQPRHGRTAKSPVPLSPVRGLGGAIWWSVQSSPPEVSYDCASRVVGHLLGEKVDIFDGEVIWAKLLCLEFGVYSLPIEFGGTGGTFHRPKRRIVRSHR